MQQKLFQIIDNIHGAIYYTDLEKEVICTPYFNRLHDVNQNSTVYLTFPPNRTKRYEHSLGVMQLTSDIFSQACVNSVGTEAMSFFLENVKDEFLTILEQLKADRHCTSLKLSDISNIDHIISHLSRNKNWNFKRTKSGLNSINKIFNDHFSDIFSDNCLAHLLPNNLHAFDSFLFLAVLQSLRLVGLLHDCGHPPQSHIVESVLMEIKDELESETNTSHRNPRKQKFLDVLNIYTRPDSVIDAGMIIKTQESSQVVTPLHEMISQRISYKILSNVINEIMKRKITEDLSIASEKDKVESEILALFYISIFEFFFAIIRNKTDFWSSLHSIVDGTLDSDQLDYVARDSKNTGMEWGAIPYKRLINTMKLALDRKNGSKTLVIAFSNKNIDIMDDILHNRYKIYTTINYHHRSAKIAKLFKESIKILAKVYLNQTDDDSSNYYYFTNISGLWKAIEDTHSPYESTMNLIQWNDSWLNGILYRELIEQTSFNEANSSELDKNELGELKKVCITCLQEIYISNKQYFSLIKRTADLMEVYNSYSNELEKVLHKIEMELSHVKEDLSKNIYDHNSKEAKEKGRDYLQQSLEFIKNDGFNFDLLARHLGNENLFQNAIESAVKSCLKVSDYFIEPVKFGLGTNDLKVYDNTGSLKSYHSYSCIKSVLFQLRNHFPYYYVYIRPDESFSESDFIALRKEIGKSMAGYIFNVLCEHVTFEHVNKQ